MIDLGERATKMQISHVCEVMFCVRKEENAGIEYLLTSIKFYIATL